MSVSRVVLELTDEQRDALLQSVIAYGMASQRAGRIRPDPVEDQEVCEARDAAFQAVLHGFYPTTVVEAHAAARRSA